MIPILLNSMIPIDIKNLSAQMEELSTKADRRFEAEKQLFVANPALFLGVSLGAWTAHALAAQIPSVPVYEYPADVVPIWSRSWIDAKKEAGYPVEFRVFVKNNEVLGWPITTRR